MSPLRNTPESLSTPRHTVGATLRSPLRVLALALGAAGVVAACSDAPTTPAAPAAPSAPRATLVGTVLGSTSVNVLTRALPLLKPVTVSVTIPPGGGSFSLPEAGLTVTVPGGLVKVPTVFWATARAGSVVAYDFGPSRKWAQPITITQSLKNTSLYKVDNPGGLFGAYFAAESAISDASETAHVDEVRPTKVDLTGNRVTFTADHFSGYTVAWGRR